MRDTLEQVFGIHAVVVRKGNDVRTDPRQPGIAGA